MREETLELESPGKARAGKKKAVSSRIKDNLWGYFFIAPTIVGLIVLNLYPVLKTMHLSLMRSSGIGRYKFIGLQNYATLARDPEVLQATKNTIIYTLAVAPVAVFLSLIVAVLLNSNIKLKGVYRTIYFIPVVSAPAAIAMVWKWLYNTRFGLLNHIFGSEIDWLSNPRIALLSIGAVGVWSLIGYNMIIFLAGLQEIPDMYYEAARIDGAGKVTQFFKITLPLISPSLFFVTVTTVMGSLKVFDLMFMMTTDTSPIFNRVQTLVVLFYRQAFVMNQKGYASAIVVLLLVIIILITIVQMRLQKKWVHY